MFCNVVKINEFCATMTDQELELLLPAMEEGLFDENWRIRKSSVELLGSLLFKVAGREGSRSTLCVHNFFSIL